MSRIEIDTEKSKTSPLSNTYLPNRYQHRITDGLSFNHCGGERFFDGLWRLADRTKAIIFWPGDEGNAVATSTEALAHADPEFIEPLQPVKIVASGGELLDYMTEQLS
jgi:hypothetical protein